MIYITSDHGGFKLKAAVVSFFESKRYTYMDLGPHQKNEADDYPDYVEVLINSIRKDPNSKGIIMCRNGVGVSMMCNRFKGIRATLSWNPQHAASSRNDDNTNVLALPADYIDDVTAINTVETWLNTEFSHETRHYHRVDRVEEYGQS